MATYEREVERHLKKNACSLIRHGKGSHNVWHSPITDRIVSVSKNMRSKTLANEILKDAGIKQKI
jgi:predicted RNA binding protein YcfA (HicA-like mRNA interferase family)